jgi:hypothetical protein
MALISFTILGEPASKANSRSLAEVGPANNRRTLFIKSEKARDYEKSARLQIPAHARQMIDVPVRATMRIYYASERPDLDESLILDVLQPVWKKVKSAPIRIRPGEFRYDEKRVCAQKGVYVNDRLVREKHVFHYIDRANPRAEIEIEPLAPRQEPMALPVPDPLDDGSIPW